MGSSGDVVSRRAIEALRSGVPNGDAVRQLGSNHPEIERRFRDLLGEAERSLDAGIQPNGLVVSGDFGGGKSHLLRYLQQVALDKHFVCSMIVVSKETLLADPVRVFRAAMAEGRVPRKVGPAMQNLASRLDYQGRAYRRFFEWAHDQPTNLLAPQFAASLYLYEYGRDMDFQNDIMRFWSGEPLSTTELKRRLREVGQQANYLLPRLPRQAELAIQRFRFATQLARADGYRGWVLLIDEAELIGQYGTRQRARAYAELARWLGAFQETPTEQVPGLATVAAITSDFETSILRSGKCDVERIPNQLRATEREQDAALATQAERGMRLIERDRISLSRPDEAYVRATHDQLRNLYRDAFGWEPPPAIDNGFAFDSTLVMRRLVRRWITGWDLQHTYPESPADVDETPLAPSLYEEDQDLEADDPDSFGPS